MTDYRVELPVFSGPMDLLLHLVREKELAASELPLAPIADQFMEYAKAIQVLDLDQGGEFLLLASTLMEIKSRELLPEPTPEEAQELEELRTDLIQKLLEYRAIRDAASDLAGRFEAQSRLFGRQVPPPEPLPEAVKPPPPGSLEVWDLVKAFTKVLRETASEKPLGVRYEEVPVAMHMERVVERVGTAGEEGLTLVGLGEPGRDRIYWIGLFLAILELVRLSKVRVRQDAAGEIRVLSPEGP